MHTHSINLSCTKNIYKAEVSPGTPSSLPETDRTWWLLAFLPIGLMKWEPCASASICGCLHGWWHTSYACSNVYKCSLTGAASVCLKSHILVPWSNDPAFCWIDTSVLTLRLLSAVLQTDPCMFIICICMNIQRCRYLSKKCLHFIKCKHSFDS